MVQSAYRVSPRSDFNFQIQGVPYLWNTVSAIDIRTTEGGEFYHPGVGRITTLSGPKRNEDITGTTVLSETQFNALEDLFESAKGADGTLVATHQIGNIRKSLLGVRIKRLSYGDGDKTSSDVAEVTIVISFQQSRRI